MPYEVTPSGDSPAVAAAIRVAWQILRPQYALDLERAKPDGRDALGIEYAKRVGELTRTLLEDLGPEQTPPPPPSGAGG